MIYLSDISLFFLHPLPNPTVNPFRQFPKQAGGPCQDALALRAFLQHRQGGCQILHVGFLETRSTTGVLECLDT